MTRWCGLLGFASDAGVLGQAESCLVPAGHAGHDLKRLRAHSALATLIDHPGSHHHTSSAQSYAEACTQADPILSELASAAAARAQADAEAAHASGAAAPRSARTAKPAAGKAPPILDPEEQKARRQAADPNFKPREKRAPSEAAAGDETKPPHPKRPRQAEQGNAEGGIAVDVASAKEDIQSDSRTAGKEAPLAEKATESAPTFTAFVKHLAPVVGREQLEELFSGCGGIAEIRFGINPSTKKSKVV